MRLCTWNVNNVRHRLPLLLAWLDATKPDIVSLQELKTTGAEFPTERQRWPRLSKQRN